MATIHLPIQIWLLLFIPQGNLPPHKNEGELKFFISNFASLSWRIALNKLDYSNVEFPVKVNDFDKTEKQNSIRINVFGYAGK